MATITGITAAKMQEYIDANVVGGSVNPMGNLILVTNDGTQIDAGGVMDPLAPGTTAQYYRGDKSWQTLNKAAVGLSNVDNTTDALKPISTSQATKNTAYDKLGGSLLAIAEATVNSGSSTAQQVILNIPTFTFLANRWYEIEWVAGIVNSSGASSLPLAQIFTCSTADAANLTTGLTELSGWNVISTAASQTIRVTPKRRIKYGSNTTLQIKAALHGNGQNCLSGAGATWPTQLTITDRGSVI